MKLEEIMGAILGRMPLYNNYGLARTIVQGKMYYTLFEIGGKSKEIISSIDYNNEYTIACIPGYEEIIGEILEEKNIYYVLKVEENRSIFKIFLEKFEKESPIQ